MHYPWLFAGFLALFFTALNLLPIGQLDGGHVIYGMFGSFYHAIISRVFFLGLVFYSGLGLISPYQTPWGGSGMENYFLAIPVYIFFLYFIFGKMEKENGRRWMWAVGTFALQYFVVQFFPEAEGYHGWLVFALIIGRLIGVDYPPAQLERPLDTTRLMLGWIAIIIFIISFSPNPLIVDGV